MVNNVVYSLLHEEYVVRTCVFYDNNMIKKVEQYFMSTTCAA